MAALLQSRWAHAPAQTQSHQSPPSAQKPEPSTETTSTEQPASTSTLSAAAATFSPAPVNEDAFTHPGASQVAQVLDLDTNESMQTRPQEDLFDDDFIPVEQPISEPEPAAPLVTAQAPPQRAEPRGRGRGRARNNATRGGHGDQHKSVPESTSEPVAAQAPENAPTGPKKEVQPAVRGDRFATGGIKKPKLSEAELAEKMAQISIKNASLSAAHARAEADAASFEQREAQAKVDATKRNEAAKERAREERRDRQQMIGEREKNRMRKLKAMEGREWDAEKNEDDFGKGGQYDKKGSFAGDQSDYTDGREYLLRDARPNGTRGGRQSSRGGKPVQQNAPRPGDFPALPGPRTQPSTSVNADSNAAGKSWADQVESSS